MGQGLYECATESLVHRIHSKSRFTTELLRYAQFCGDFIGYIFVGKIKKKQKILQIFALLLLGSKLVWYCSNCSCDIILCVCFRFDYQFDLIQYRLLWIYIMYSTCKIFKENKINLFCKIYMSHLVLHYYNIEG